MTIETATQLGQLVVAGELEMFLYCRANNLFYPLRPETYEQDMDAIPGDINCDDLRVFYSPSKSEVPVRE